MHTRAPPREAQSSSQKRERKRQNHRIPRLNNSMTNKYISQTLIYCQCNPNNNQNMPVCRVCKQMTQSSNTEKLRALAAGEGHQKHISTQDAQ